MARVVRCGEWRLASDVSLVPGWGLYENGQHVGSRHDVGLDAEGLRQWLSSVGVPSVEAKTMSRAAVADPDDTADIVVVGSDAQ